MKLENLDIKRLESKNINIVKYRDWVITFLKNQVLLRDNIQIEQRHLLEKNAISNTINYNGLKVVNKIEENMDQKPKDFVFPPINGKQAYQDADSKVSKNNKVNKCLYMPKILSVRAVTQELRIILQIFSHLQDKNTNQVFLHKIA